jgi:hypothetical protein
MSAVIITPGDCLACFINSKGAPSGDVSVVFMAGFVQGQQREEVIKRVEATFCLQHRKVHADMKLVTLHLRGL